MADCREDIGGRLLSVPDVGRERAGVPRSVRHLPGHGSTDGTLLHQLVAQHVPLGPTVRWKVVRRDVSTGAPSRLQVRRQRVRCSVLFTLKEMKLWDVACHVSWASSGFSPGVGKLGVWGRKSPSGVQGWSPSGAWGRRPRSRRQVHHHHHHWNF